MNRDDIIDFIWNCSFDTLDVIKSKISFDINDNNEIITNFSGTLYLRLDQVPYMEELPFKFGRIEGSFFIECYDSRLKNFKGFPTFVAKDLAIAGGAFESTKGWNIKEVGNLINFCSPYNKIDNLEFLKNTMFNRFYLQVVNPALDKNTTDYYLNLLNNVDGYKELKYIERDSMNMLKDLIIKDKKERIEVDSYLESFNNIIENGIK